MEKKPLDELCFVLFNHDVNVPMDSVSLISPKNLKEKLPLDRQVAQAIELHRREIQDILQGQLQKKLLIFGPCSVHNAEEILEYAYLFKQIKEEMYEQFFCVLRVYIEKPRSCLGWKGFLYDPHVDDSHDFEGGLTLSRELFLQLSHMGIPLAMEFLEPLVSLYFEDLICWGSIGARTCSSQIHRQLAASLPFAVGFKNAVDGNIKIACESILSSQHPHTFFGVNNRGSLAKLTTAGNPFTHLVLRGSVNSSNYDSKTLSYTQDLLNKMGLSPHFLLDCAHGNSGKTVEGQISCFESLVLLWEKGAKFLAGGMLETYLKEGKQYLVDESPIKEGLSLTDPCLGLERTYTLLQEAYLQLKNHYSSSKTYT